MMMVMVMMMIRRRRRRRTAYQPREYNTTQKHISVLTYITDQQIHTYEYVQSHITRIYSSSTCFGHFLWPSSRCLLPRIQSIYKQLYKNVWLNHFTLRLNCNSAACGLKMSYGNSVKTDNTPRLLPLPTYLATHLPTYIPTLHTSAVYAFIYVINLCTCRQNLFTKYIKFTYITSTGYFLQLCCSLLQAVNQLLTLSKQNKKTP